MFDVLDNRSESCGMVRRGELEGLKIRAIGTLPSAGTGGVWMEILDAVKSIFRILTCSQE